MGESGPFIKAATPLPLSEALLARFDAAYAAHQLVGCESVASASGNPFGLERGSWGRLMAWRSPRLNDTAGFNCAEGVENATDEQLAAMVAWYRAVGAAVTVRVSPVFMSDELSRRLSRLGLFQERANIILCGQPHASDFHIDGIEVREVGHDRDALDTFMTIWTNGISKPPRWHVDWDELWRPWFEMPGYRLYLAMLDGQPAGILGLWGYHGVAQLHASVTLLEFRGHGCQAALIHRCITDAAAAGFDVISATSTFGSTGHRNVARAGLQMAGTAVMWRDSQFL